MKHRFLKVVACISLIAMVLSAVMPGALADDTGTTDSKEFGEKPMKQGLRGNPGMSDEGPIEAMEFESDEEEMEFIVEMHTERINNRIERLTERLTDLEEDTDEYEAISEDIEELEALLEDIEEATTLDELKEILNEARESMMPEMRGEKPEREEMEFDSDEEEMEFVVERQTERINHRIEMLNGMLENIDEIEDENITEDSIEEQITELEALLEDIEGATTLDELREILEEYRENNPQPSRHGGEHGQGPMENGSDEE
ncbi:hypothetical protein [Methanolobus sp. WCC4]|uniref:hypothetical protein n=1 Tax=Methanolobus sp. WCC4 TaxID=3125784 RepID=UPI0030FA5744